MFAPVVVELVLTRALMCYFVHRLLLASTGISMARQLAGCHVAEMQQRRRRQQQRSTAAPV